jgi:putative transposase
LRGLIAEKARELIRRICVENRVEILSGVVSGDHIHILVSMDPSMSVSKLVMYIKRKTSRQLQMKFPELKKRYWGQQLWARGYFAVSVGNVTADMIQDYIDGHMEGEESDDPFQIESCLQSTRAYKWHQLAVCRLQSTVVERFIVQVGLHEANVLSVIQCIVSF